MNRLNISLTTKLIVIIAVAVILPLIILMLVFVNTLHDVTFDNLETLVQENGLRRQQNIQAELATALDHFDRFIADNRTVLSNSINQRNLDDSNEDFIFAADRAARSRMQDILLATRYFSQAQVLDSDFSVLAMTLDDTDSISNAEQQEIASTALAMITQDDYEQRFIIFRDADAPLRIDILQPLIQRDSLNNNQVIGYVLAELSIEAIFMPHLQIEDSNYTIYSYVILPDSLQVIAPPSVLTDSVIDTDSRGARSVISGRSGTAIYPITANRVSEGDEAVDTQEVIGYFSPIVALESSFSLVTEIQTDAILNGLQQRILSQAFILALFIIALILISSLWITNQMIVPSLQNLRQAIVSMIRGNYDVPVAETVRGDEIGSLANSLVDMRQFMSDLVGDLNKRLNARIRDVRVTQEISRTVTIERDLDMLSNQVVSLIVKNFEGIYHAQIFLLDDDGKYAVLRASTGAAGRELLSRGHKLGVGSVSVVGQAAEQRQVVIARDTSESVIHRENVFLEETRSELAIPLILGNRIIGVLDVQSKEYQIFDENKVVALQTLADQITIAIENTRLYAEREQLLRDTQDERARTTRLAWQHYLDSQRRDDLTAQAGVSTNTNFFKLTEAVYENKQTIIGDETIRQTVPFSLPIILRDQLLGVVKCELPKQDFTYDKVLLAEELISRLAISLENARLFQNTEQSTQREQVLNDIAAKLTNQSDVQTILQTAVKEIERALRTPQVAIRLHTSSTDPMNGSTQPLPDIADMPLPTENRPQS